MEWTAPRHLVPRLSCPPTERTAQMELKRVGLDTSKAIFTVHGVDQNERVVVRVI